MPIRITGLNSGLDTDSLVQELVSANRTKVDTYKKAQTKLSWTQDAWKDMNSKIYSFYSTTLSDMRRSGSYSKKKTVVSDTTKASVSAGSNVVNGTQSLKIKALATAGYLTGAKLDAGEAGTYTSSSKLSDLGVTAGTMNFKVGEEDKSVEITEDMTIAQFTAALKEQGITANFDESQQRFFLGTVSSGVENDFNFTVGNAGDLAQLSSLGLATAANYVNAGVTAGDDTALAVKADAANAIIELNGATFESSSNQMTINGLTITATGVTGDDAISINTSTDVDGIYDMIKKFVTEYNTLVNAMEKAYNADSAKGYEPLTDDEKEDMSDTEIEKWETKIKDALLRRDSTLSTVLTGMSSMMATSYEYDGKSYTLSSFGVASLSYFNRAENETYSYHINGDQEDSSVSDQEDKLRAMIQEDPDAVAGFFSQLATGVYDKLHESMGTTTLSSIYKVYNDKQMQSEYDDYTETIEKWEEKLEDLEDYYYDKFSAMETALANLQSQTNSLTSLLGG